MNSWQRQPIELPEEFKRFKDRDFRWLWRYMTQLGAPLPLEHSVARSERQATIASTINMAQNPQAFVRQLTAAHADLVMSEDHLKWLDKDDDRLLIWMLARVQELYQQAPGQLPFQLLWTAPEARRDEVILALDLWNIPVDQKIQWMHGYRGQWAQARTPDADTQWIDPKDRSQLTWAWDYLHKAFKAMNLPAPTNTRDYYACVLASLDNLSLGHPAEKKLFLEKMKKTWSQKKYRDSGKAKKPYYMPLSKEARSKLETLAKHHELSPHDFVEMLIESAYKEAHPDGQGLIVNQHF
ncbi:hypothetical protein S7S_05505 [Isoalcanivorax pacificus W11-5]|uniref:Uncharacterized protein n=1 Tax=Isoalcanivorax pacificus W11-5 TaxID=391936 RepID=A0A0B4XKA9_9GAMM|nr:hypothetical protein [Isoalcanivorax pacificus]AJD47521.1 hypothetical protein S7S_05505 [Isoalcanivorax pacificus W11-5]